MASLVFLSVMVAAASQPLELVAGQTCDDACGLLIDWVVRQHVAGHYYGYG